MTSRAGLYDQAITIVNREYASDLGLDEIAFRIVTSRRQLQRVFSEVGHTTFRDYLTRVRMEKAAELLAQQDLSVKEVARRVGYRQSAQFAKAFRRYIGDRPSMYRASGQEDGGVPLH
jgi:transcriptional regulator GlxA family with amidase domain